MSAQIHSDASNDEGSQDCEEEDNNEMAGWTDSEGEDDMYGASLPSAGLLM